MPTFSSIWLYLDGIVILLLIIVAGKVVIISKKLNRQSSITIHINGRFNDEPSSLMFRFTGSFIYLRDRNKTCT